MRCLPKTGNAGAGDEARTDPFRGLCSSPARDGCRHRRSRQCSFSGILRGRNPHTRRAYGFAVAEFLACCKGVGVASITTVQSPHVAAWIEQQTRTDAAPTVKRPAALRRLLDRLVPGQVMPANSAASVRGPSDVVKVGKTPVLEPAEARALLDSIDVTTPVGLRDRALIALMVYPFARIGAALAMKVEDVYTRNRRLWVRLRENGGKAHAVPCPDVQQCS